MTVAAYEYEHVVTFEETNVVGNVYFSNFVLWQGHCREHFLRDHAPDVLARLRDDLVMVTTKVSCSFYAEVFALERVVVEMTLGACAANRLSMRFRYRRGNDLVATGEQAVACLRRTADGGLMPEPVPETLALAASGFVTAV